MFVKYSVQWVNEKNNRVRLLLTNQKKKPKKADIIFVYGRKIVFFFFNDKQNFQYLISKSSEEQWQKNNLDMNAKDILIKAVQCDKIGRILEAQHLYQDGIQLLMDLVSGGYIRACVCTNRHVSTLV